MQAYITVVINEGERLMDELLELEKIYTENPSNLFEIEQVIKEPHFENQYIIVYRF